MKDYRAIAERCSGPDPWMDWRSDVYVDGTWRCVKIADSYLPPSSGVLDLGCGMGLVSSLLSRYGYNVQGTDIDIGGQYAEVSNSCDAGWGSLADEIKDPEMLTRCWKLLSSAFGVQFTRYDGQHLPFEDASFEGVVMHAVFEHVDEEALRLILKEIRRVLTTNGLLFIFRTPRPEAYLEKLGALMKLPVHELTYREETVEQITSDYGFAKVWSGVTDLVPSFPPVNLKLYNAFAPLMTKLDGLLLKTPLKRYAHHMALVLKK